MEDPKRVRRRNRWNKRQWVSRKFKRLVGRILCGCGLHKWKQDSEPVNRVLWRFCERCGGRQGIDEPFGDFKWM